MDTLQDCICKRIFDDKIPIVVSLGTGVHPYEPEKINEHVGCMYLLKTILFGKITTVDSDMQELQSQQLCDKYNKTSVKNYFRLNPPIRKDISPITTSIYDQIIILEDKYK